MTTKAGDESLSNASSGDIHDAEKATPKAITKTATSDSRQEENSRISTLQAVILFMPIILLCAILIAVSSISTTKLTDPDHGCTPGGKVWVGAMPIFTWNIDLVLDITMSFGELTFPEAKLIDVTWDLVIGRGLQIATGLVVYYVFRRHVAQQMRHQPRPYEKFLSMQYATTSWGALRDYWNDMISRSKDPRPISWMSVLLFFSTGYVLFLPTWLSAMSGYQARMAPLFKTQDGTYINYKWISPRCEYVIKDGWRIGRQNFTCAPYNSPFAEAIKNYNQTLYEGMRNSKWALSVLGESDFQVWQYMTKSIFHFKGNNTPLTNPSLEIYIPEATGGAKHLFMDGMPALWTYQDKYYTRTTLEENSICQPQNSYSWGVSFLQLFVFLVVTIIFAVLLYVAWIRSASRHDVKGTKKMFGRFRTAIEVTTALQQDFGEKTVEMTDHELDIYLSNQRKKNS